MVNLSQVGVAYKDTTANNTTVIRQISSYTKYWNNNVSNSTGDYISPNEGDRGFSFFNTQIDGQILPNKSMQNRIIYFSFSGQAQVDTSSSISIQLVPGWSFKNPSNNIQQLIGGSKQYTFSFNNTRRSFDGEIGSKISDENLLVTTIDSNQYYTYNIPTTYLAIRSVFPASNDHKLYFYNFKINEVAYIPGCYITIHNVKTGSQVTETYIDNATFILPSPTDLGYRLDGWKLNNTGEIIPSGTEITTDDVDLHYYDVWTKLYKINFYSDNTLFISKNQQVVGNSANPSSNPSKKTHQFMGWTTDSTKTIYDSSWHGTSNSANKFWATGTNLPVVADSQIDTNEQPTEDGFIIKYHAVWRQRESVTVHENVSNIGNVVFPYVSVKNSNIYYFDEGASKQFFIELKDTTTRYYIHDINTGNNTPTFITNGTFTTNKRYWQSLTNEAPIAGITGANTDIYINYYGNLKLQFSYRQNDRNLDSAFTNIFDTMYQLNKSYILNDPNVVLEEDFSKTISSSEIEGNSYIYLNPGEGITYTLTCLNDKYYISQFGTSNSIINRVDLLSSSNPSLNQNCNTLSFTYTASDSDMSNTVNPALKAYYVFMDPFYCKFEINNINNSIGLNEDIDFEFVRVKNNLYYIFNDYVDVIDPYNSDIAPIQGFDNSLYDDEPPPCRITNVSINNVDINVQINQLISNLSFLSKPSINSSDYFQLYDSQNPNSEINLGDRYYLSRFNGYAIYPQSYMLEHYQSDPYTIDITWNSNIYQSFIIIKLPVQGEDANTLETDTTLINSVISYENNNWNQQIVNNKIISYLIVDPTVETNINFTLNEINHNYQFKELKKYSYAYNNESNAPTVYSITHQSLENGNAWPTSFEWTKNHTNEINDILILDNDNLFVNQVDYYFITYEKTPIYYSDNTGNLSQPIQFYWEGNKIIGVYYGNIKIL